MADVRSSGSLAAGTTTVTPGRGKLYGVVLNTAAAIASVALNDGTGGAQIVLVSCVSLTDSKFLWFPEGIVCNTNISAVVTGVGATANVFFIPNA